MARPDHSIFLYEGLKKFPQHQVEFHTFGVFKRNTIPYFFIPTAKTVTKEVHISYAFTFFHRLLYLLSDKITFDYYKTETQIAEYFYAKILQKTQPVDIIHYWSFYCQQSVSRFHQQNPNTKLLADVYAAHPSYVQELLAPEFDKFGLSIHQSHFVKSSKRDLACLENAPNLIVPSTYLADIYRRYFPDKQLFTAGYGLLKSPDSLIRSTHQRKKAQVFRIVFIGKISIEKGCFYLLECLRKLPETEFYLEMIGEIETAQLAVFKPYFNDANIKFLGKLPNSKIMELLPSYHVLVLPSLTEAYSLAVSEALGRKIPVIITENVGNKDDVEHFQVGILCKIQSVEALQEAIVKCTNEDYRQCLVSNINRFIKENQENNYTTRVLEIYQQLLHGRD
jgi:glycosyltransferase involved in cell wall biosynthesis